MATSPTELSKAAGISLSYASMLLSEDPKQARSPSLKTAFQIYDATGLQFGILEGLSEETIEELRPKAVA